jgi:addiction module RelE/StbE family toxin
MRVEWTRRALGALDGIADYIAQDSPTAARRIVQRIRAAVADLESHPWIGRAGRVAGTRELVVADTPFIVPYRVRDETLEILTVMHAARKWPEDF